MLDVHPDAQLMLCDLGYDPTFGARPLNRVIAQHIMNPLAKALLNGEIREEETARFVVQHGDIVLLPNHERSAGDEHIEPPPTDLHLDH